VTSPPHARADGSLYLSGRVSVPADEVDVRVTTSGGPGGQHANRAQTKVVATFRIEDSTVLSDAQRARAVAQVGPVVRSSAGRFRSQSMNRSAALDQLARRLAVAIAPPTPRRATRPTRSSTERRLEEKRTRAKVKQARRVRDDD